MVFWTWGGGWLYRSSGFLLTFAGSTIVHMTGGIVALVLAPIYGGSPRTVAFLDDLRRHPTWRSPHWGRSFLWFGWYGFNVGSTLGAGDVNQMGLGCR